MKKRIVALLLGGVLAAGSLAMHVSAPVWAANMSECNSSEHYPESSSHINSSDVKTVDGKLAVAIDLEFEHEDGYFELYVYDKQLEKTTAGDFQFYPITFEKPLNEVKSLKQNDTYIFEEFADNKTYYVYCVVYDNHGDGESDTEDEKVMYLHYAAYLGSATPTVGSDTPSDSEDSSITKEECGFRSEPHIKNTSIVAGDGQFTVTVDIKHEVSGAGVEIYMFDRELNKDTLNEIDSESGLDNVSKELRDELAEEGIDSWMVDDSRKKFVHVGESYTFTGLENGKTRYLYAAVVDGHDQTEEAIHSYVYLGYVTPTSNSGSGSGGSSSDNNTSDSGSSDNGSSNSVSVTPPRDYAKEAEEKVLGQIQAAPANSTVVMDKSVTTLSNKTMKELQKKGNISLKLDFTYMGQRYVITIPAGAVLDDTIPWYGPLYLAQQFGNSAAANEVNAKGTEQELIAQIKETPAHYTIVMDKGVTTLSNAVIKELQKKGDVSLKLEFTYENKEYVITIPAGASFDDNISWYGPMYLIQHFGNSAENAN